MMDKLFRHLKSQHVPFLIWQIVGNERIMIDSFLNTFNYESKLLYFEQNLKVKFHQHHPVYCYAENLQMLFTASINESAEKFLSLIMPEEVKILSEDDHKTIQANTGLKVADSWKVKSLNIDRIMQQSGVKSMAERSERDKDFLSTELQPVSLDEEDKLYADKREAPRARPKKEKYIKLRLEEKRDTHYLKLFDLSQGGLSFITHNLNEFPKGSTIQILGFDSFDLDDPLIGRVMSHRAIDELEVEWKVGVKFDDGQS